MGGPAYAHAEGGRPLMVSRFPSKNAVKAEQRLPRIHRDILAFARAVLPQRRNRHALRCLADRRHRAKSERTGNDEILPLERELAATVGDCQADIPKYIVYGLVEVEFWRCLGIGQLRLECLSQTPACATVGRFVSHIIHCALHRWCWPIHCVLQASTEANASVCGQSWANAAHFAIT